MDEPFLTTDRPTVSGSGAPPLTASSPRAPALARVSALPWLLFLVVTVIAAWLAWRQFRPADIGDPLATSLIAFEKQDKLTVFSAQLAPVVSSDDARLFGLVKSKQVAVIPARVDYTIALDQVGRDRMKWDAANKTLSVRLPPLTVSRPNLDEARAQYLREGVWITRDAQDKLTRDNTRLAEQIAVEQARNPVLMNLARGAAKEAIRQNLAIPLQVAGYGEVKVVVLFDGEANPG
ncbi:DUF4230 domain-containing protein [Novosphingobium sp.]|uniref:DUF4230 domain-containing protein n=1 Tax=Novosphingobium sp. TaxID=1874826 RepID=UPI00352A5FAD